MKHVTSTIVPSNFDRSAVLSRLVSKKKNSKAPAKSAINGLCKSPDSFQRKRKPSDPETRINEPTWRARNQKNGERIISFSLLSCPRPDNNKNSPTK